MSLKDTISCAEEVVTVAIGSGASVSGAIDLGGLRLFGVIMPSAWTSAALTVLASFDGGATFAPMKSVYDDTELTCNVSAGAYYPLPNPSIYAAVPMIKVQSGTSAAPVAQAANRSLQLVLRSI